MSELPLPTVERGECFCPECGQSLNLSSHLGVATRRRTPEPWLFAILGLCLAVLFGVRSWQAHDALAGLDRQIEDNRAATIHGVFGTSSDQEMAQAEWVNPLLTDRVPLQQSFERAVTGLVLGLIAISAGAGTLIRRRGELTESRWPGHEGIDAAPSSRSSLVRIALSLWALGDALAGSLFRVLLIVFGGSVGEQLARGLPMSRELVEQALIRTVEVVTAIGGLLA